LSTFVHPRLANRALSDLARAARVRSSSTAAKRPCSSRTRKLCEAEASAGQSESSGGPVAGRVAARRSVRGTWGGEGRGRAAWLRRCRRVTSAPSTLADLRRELEWSSSGQPSSPLVKWDPIPYLVIHDHSVALWRTLRRVSTGVSFTAHLRRAARAHLACSLLLQPW